jgi:hypothetical protein
MLKGIPMDQVRDRGSVNNAPFPPEPGGIDLAISQIRKSWPAATPAEAGHALRTFLGLEGATVERAARWFERAPRLPGMDRAGLPWRAAATLHRAGPWLAAEDRRTTADMAERARAARSCPPAFERGPLVRELKVPAAKPKAEPKRKRKAVRP